MLMIELEFIINFFLSYRCLIHILYILNCKSIPSNDLHNLHNLHIRKLLFTHYNPNKKTKLILELELRRNVYLDFEFQKLLFYRKRTLSWK